MKFQLIFGCVFAAAAFMLNASEKEPENEFCNLVLSEEETKENGYLFAFADNSGIAFKMVNEEIAQAEESSEEEEIASVETSQAEDV